MNARALPAWLAVAGLPVVAVAQSAPQSAQYAKTLAACSAAINNAGAGATVNNTIICNGLSKADKARLTRTEKAVERLEANGRRNAAVDSRQSGDIASLQAQLATERREREKLAETVAQILASGSAAGASSEDRQIAALTEKGDARGAAALIEAKAAKQQGDTANLYLQAANLLATTDVRLALQAAERAVAADPVNINALWRAGDLALLAGDSTAAMRRYEQMRDVLEAALRSQPQDLNLRHYLSISYEKVGNVLLLQGNVPDALKAYQDALAISERLVKADPFNARAQRDLLISYSNVGDVLFQQDNTLAALKAYQNALAINERLAKSDLSNTEAQRDLSITYNKVGDVVFQQGNAPAALKAYQDSLVIRERLANDDQSSAQAQRDLVVSHNRLARTALATNDKVGAIKQLEMAEAILVALLARVGDNAQYTRDQAQVREFLARLRAQ